MVDSCGHECLMKCVFPAQETAPSFVCRLCRFCPSWPQVRVLSKFIAVAGLGPFWLSAAQCRSISPRRHFSQRFLAAILCFCSWVQVELCQAYYWCLFASMVDSCGYECLMKCVWDDVKSCLISSVWFDLFFKSSLSDLCFYLISVFWLGSEDCSFFNSYMVLIELEERRIKSILEYRSSLLEKF
jgi:hypothetical protein